MGKRSDFERRERDFYPTPFAPAQKLARHLPPGFTFCEPCAGENDLVRHLETLGGKCVWSSDLPLDARGISKFWTNGATHIITNPPWPAVGGGGSPTTDILRACIATEVMTWFLLSADFMHNAYFAEFYNQCRFFVSVGRVKWIPDSGMTGKDNACWYGFHSAHVGGPRMLLHPFEPEFP